MAHLEILAVIRILNWSQLSTHCPRWNFIAWAQSELVPVLWLKLKTLLMASTECWCLWHKPVNKSFASSKIHDLLTKDTNLFLILNFEEGMDIRSIFLSVVSSSTGRPARVGGWGLTWRRICCTVSAGLWRTTAPWWGQTRNRAAWAWFSKRFLAQRCRWVWMMQEAFTGR